MMSKQQMQLRGSERMPLPGAKAIGKADPSERLEVSILVRRNGADTLTDRVAQLAKGEKAGSHLTREAFAREHGADQGAVAAVREFAISHGLAVVQEHAATRTVILSGTVAQFNQCFGVELQTFQHEGGTYRGRTGAIHLPGELQGAVDAVLGLDNRPQAKPHFRMRSQGNVQYHAMAQGPASFTPDQLASLYSFPSGSGQGQCIALIELGGGFRPADITSYFNRLNMTAPQVTAISVDHGRNQPTGDMNGPDAEVMLDIDVAGAVAPGARLAVYFAPNTDAGFLDAINSAIHDSVHKPSVISISWGSAECNWTEQALNAYNELFQEAAVLGVTICAAAGDNGSSDGMFDGTDHVDFPSSSPYVLACGGTRLHASQGKIMNERVWNDGESGGTTGGGISTFFPVPAWQHGLKATTGQGTTIQLQRRGVPDLAADADPLTGYDICVDGHYAVMGGTSAVAPLMAGLIARVNAAKGSPVGFITARLYKTPAALNDVKTGNNGTYAASPTWDACTGLGTPNGRKISEIL